MSSIYDSRQRLKYLFILIATLIAIVSVFVSDKLVKSLAQEERQKVEIWAEAQRMIATETNGSNMALILKILESNTTIPVLWCNEKDSVIAEKNIDLPEKDSDLFLKNKVRELKSKNPPILIDMQDGTFQYLYYYPEKAAYLSLCPVDSCFHIYPDRLPGSCQYEEGRTE